MKFNIYNTTTVNGAEVTSTKMELEMSVEELATGCKHTIDLLEHSFEIKSLIQGVADTILEVMEKVGYFKMNSLDQQEKEMLLKDLSPEDQEKFRELERRFAQQNKEVA